MDAHVHRRTPIYREKEIRVHECTRHERNCIDDPHMIRYEMN